MNLKLFNLARSANGVRRYHTVTNVITPETVGHHTSGVIGILFCIYDQEPSLRLIEAALYHDTPEYITGDTPATAKWDFPDLNLALDTA
jgi:5'-deoxynucleotidase YfbR-like HD superfamily hydrolase